MIELALLLGFLVAILLSGLFSGLETGLYTTSRLRLFLDDHGGVLAARRARQLLADMPTLLSVLLVSNNVANSLASTLAQALLVGLAVESPELWGTFVVSVVLFVFGESVPKSAFRRGREKLLYPALPALSVTYVVLRIPVRPLTWMVSLLTSVVQKRLRTQKIQPSGPREAMLAEGAAEGFLSAFQERVARGVLALRERRAQDEAVPLETYARARVGVAAIELPTGCRDHRVLVLDSGGRELIGWIPMARLAGPRGFRAPVRRELYALPTTDPQTGLDRLYVALQRDSQPFAAVRIGADLRVVDAARLRQRIMGTFGQPRGSVR